MFLKGIWLIGDDAGENIYYSCEGNEEFEIYKTNADEMNSDNSVKVADYLTYLLVNRAGLDILFK